MSALGEEDSSLSKTRLQIQRFRQGDVAAGNLLFERYRRRVFAIVRIRVGNHAQAEDLTQETLLSAFRKLEGFDVDSEGRLIDWIARIAERKVRDAWKYDHRDKRDVDRQLALDDVAIGGNDSSAAWEPPSNGSRPLDKAEREEMGALVEKCICDLPENYREVILLRDFAGCSWKSIAEVLQLTSVRALHGRARATLASLVRSRS